MPFLFRKLPLEGNDAHLEAHSIGEVINLLGSVSPDDQHVFPARRIDPRFDLQDLIRTFKDPQHVAIRLRWMHGPSPRVTAFDRTVSAHARTRLALSRQPRTVLVIDDQHISRRGYFPRQQQQPPQSSPLQQHFSQQQDSPQQSQQALAAATLAGAGLPLPRNGNTARTMDENFMDQR